MKIVWSENSWKDYLYCQQTDNKILKKINTLIKDIQRDPFEGVGKPEPLRYQYSGFWSRRITSEHRLVYMIDDESIKIASCRYH